jgi:MFS family permease
MLVEFAPAHRRGFFGSFQMCSQALAFSLGAAVAYLLTTRLDAGQLESWGWRLPFLFGILIGPVGWIIRSRVDESPEFLAYRRAATTTTEKATRTPLRDLVRKYPREMISSTGICVVGTVSAYVFVFFLPIFAKQRLGIAAADANLATFLGTAVILLCCPLGGYLSDRYGRKAVLLPGMLGYGVAAWVFFHHFIAAPSFQSLVMLQVGVSFFMSFMWAPVPIVLTEVFPVGVRSTGAALTYNLAVLLFGGLAPFINTWLVKVTGSNTAPLYYVLFSLLIGVVSTLLFLELGAGRLRTRAAS